MLRISVTVMSTPDHEILMPSEQATALLRMVANEWLEWPDYGETDLDQKTVRTLANVLIDLADQVDVECIAFASWKHAD